jgi:hypothetical protein
MRFLGGIFKQFGLRLALILIIYATFESISRILWTRDNVELFYQLAGGRANLAREFIIHVIMFGSAMVLGARAGYSYVPQNVPLATPLSPPKAFQWFQPTRLAAFIERHHRVWHITASIGIAPLILGVTILIQSMQNRGVFFGDFNHSSARILRWTSNHEIEFKTESFFLTDCVGCSPIYHTVEHLDIDTGQVTVVRIEEEEFSLQYSPTRPRPISRPISPDGSKEAYVVNDLDIFVRNTQGLKIGWPVYINPSKDFFTRYTEQILAIFTASFLAAPLLLFPLAWKRRTSTQSVKLYAVITSLNVLMFLGTMLPFRPLNVIYAIWIPIP